MPEQTILSGCCITKKTQWNALTFFIISIDPWLLLLFRIIEKQNNSFISGETWENTISLQARVLNSNSLFVTCECLVDKENEILELRDFPRILFALLDLNSVEYVIIKLREKPGSSRIDIYEAKNMVDKSAFEIKDMWADLENSGVDQPIKQDD